MNVGFYFHIPMVREGDGVRVPGHFGRFIEALALRAGSVTFYGHVHEPSGAEDFLLAPPLVRAVDMGPRRSAPANTFRPQTSMRHVRPDRDGVDVMLIRGPSPLLPYFAAAAGDVPVAYFLQGDNRTASAAKWMPAYRRAAIRGWKELYAVQQRRALRGRLVFVNSRSFARDIAGRADVRVVLSSVVPAASIAPPLEGDGAPPLKLAYAGRIAEEKGLLELLAAIAELAKRGIDTTVSIFGKPDDAIFGELLERRANELGIGDRVHMPGYLSLDELGCELRRHDLFVLTSFHEGFPHGVLDAMAAGVPVLATRVGGIPDELTDGDQALLIEPRSIDAIVDALTRVASEPHLRRSLAQSGNEWVREHTVERMADALVSGFEELLSSSTPSAGSE